MSEGFRHCIYIRAVDGVFEEVFCFETQEEDGAWFELDGAEAEENGAVLSLNADREVYAVYEKDGEKKYGTIGDDENEYEPDNFPFCDGETYLFYEKPETKDYYI